MTEQSNPKIGGCTCGNLRYEMTSEPMIVHCCHCRGCQKNSGSAFALNALIEADRVKILSGELENITVPTPSGKGQIISRCVNCKVAVWSNYNMGGLRERIRFVRVGTLDKPDQMPPNIHIYTSSKQPWVRLVVDDRAVSHFYEFGKTWSYEGLKRLKILENDNGISVT